MDEATRLVFKEFAQALALFSMFSILLVGVTLHLLLRKITELRDQLSKEGPEFAKFISETETWRKDMMIVLREIRNELRRRK